MATAAKPDRLARADAKASSPFRTYRLAFVEDRFGAQKYLDFEAAHAGTALEIAAKEARGRIADLYEDGRYLCSLERSDPAGGGLWVVSFGSLAGSFVAGGDPAAADDQDRDRDPVPGVA